MLIRFIERCHNLFKVTKVSDDYFVMEMDKEVFLIMIEVFKSLNRLDWDDDYTEAVVKQLESKL